MFKKFNSRQMLLCMCIIRSVNNLLHRNTTSFFLSFAFHETRLKPRNGLPAEAFLYQT